MIFPKRILFGESAVTEMRVNEIPRLKKGLVLLVISETLHLKKKDAWLISAFIACNVHVDIHVCSSEPTITDIDIVAKKYKKKSYNLIIGFGGGSVMDLAKALSLCLSTKVDCLTLLNPGFEGKRNVELWLVPSTAGTGSEVNNLSIINTSNGKKAIVNDNIIADLVICNSEILDSLTYSTKLFSLIDTLSHAVESLTAKRNTVLSEFYSAGALNLIVNNHQKYLFGSSNANINSKFQLASLSAGLAFGYTGVHLVHAFAYGLVEQMPLKHSRSVAIVIFPILEYWFTKKSKEIKSIKKNTILIKQLLDLLDKYKEKIYNNLSAHSQNKKLLVQRVLANHRLLNNSLITYTRKELEEIADNIYDRIQNT